MKKTFVLFLLLMLSVPVAAQEKTLADLARYFSDLSIDMQWFLSYQNGEKKGEKFNEFGLKRGYVNIKKRINKVFSGRITTDITVDREGDGEGDVEMRLKYLYIKTELPDFSFLSKPYLEFGLVHTPWLDFEQNINLYRVQGSMFLDRTGVTSSADYGLVFISNIGGDMDDDYKENVNNKFAGKYGSLAFGVFNGGGYHALEKNINKAVEGRVSIRPLPYVIPGLQFTWHGALGKGNIAESPDWEYNSGFVSFESESFILTGEYFGGEGNFRGDALFSEDDFTAADLNGYSFFTEIKIFDSFFSIIGRYDRYKKEQIDADLQTDRYIGGVAWHFIKGCKLLVDYDHLDYVNGSSPDTGIFEVAVELMY